MDLKITDQVVAGFRDKDSKVPAYRKLYEEMPFIDAYAKHTDMRMAIEPKGAIGRVDEWEGHGTLQLDFLKSQGLSPASRLLDIGCGPGRLARRVCPYLDVGNYLGVDISDACIKYAINLALDEGWSSRAPLFVNGSVERLESIDGMVDFAWAHSVFTHLPPQEIDVWVRRLTRLLKLGGVFLFTYKQAVKPQRSGLKQFQYPIAFFDEVARGCGGRAQALPTIWPAHQLTGKISGLSYATL